MLERQLDDLKLLMNRGPVLPSSTSVLTESYIDPNLGLASRVSGLEGLINNQNIFLEECSAKSKLLLEENESLKFKLDKALCGIESLQCAQDNINSNKTDKTRPSSCTGGGSTQSVGCDEQLSRSSLGVAVASMGFEGSELCKVIINGALKKDIEINDDIAKGAAFAVLRTVLPSLEKDNVLEARVLRARGLPERSLRETGGSPGLRSDVPPSCIVRLSSAGLVREVMRGKLALTNNYLTTGDINPQLLEQVSAACMSSHKEFINEMLPHEKFQVFKSLRSVAQGLGFKYVWHSGGRFLARRKGGERVHLFATAADLQAIHTACQAAPKQHLPKGESPNCV